jgi:hypothetical protein
MTTELTLQLKGVLADKDYFLQCHTEWLERQLSGSPEHADALIQILTDMTSDRLMNRIYALAMLGLAFTCEAHESQRAKIIEPEVLGLTHD